MDILSRKNKRGRPGESDDESDDGPPPDPDEVVPTPVKKEKDKKTGEAKEVQVSVRKTGEEKSGVHFQGGVTVVRREMLMIIRGEEDEKWEDYEYCDPQVGFMTRFYEVYLLFFSRLKSLRRRLRPYSRMRVANSNVKPILRLCSMISVDDNFVDSALLIYYMLEFVSTDDLMLAACNAWTC